MNIHYIYRVSDNGYPKKKFEFATKVECLDNFIVGMREGSENLHILLDNTKLKDDTHGDIDALLSPPWIHAKLVEYTGGSSAASWRYAWNYVKEQGFSEDDYVYFVEDDYLHKRNFPIILKEGLQLADYVSLYDHMDKYIPASKGGNKYVGEDGGETTKVVLTKSTHWKLTNSTTMTFAAQISTLVDDEEIWARHTLGSHPNDFGAFIELRHKGKSLITPIPGWSTHCEDAWVSPLIDWEKIV